jgi:hypothetical protein
MGKSPVTFSFVESKGCPQSLQRIALNAAGLRRGRRK